MVHAQRTSRRPAGSRFPLPRYERAVWRRWLVLTVTAVVPAGAALGFLFGDPANGEMDTALAWGSTAELLRQLGIGIWVLVVAWSAVYFERVNDRVRQRSGGRSGPRGGFALAITALVFAIFALSPVALLIDAVAWQRIRRSSPYARGMATAAVAALASIALLPLWMLELG